MNNEKDNIYDNNDLDIDYKIIEFEIKLNDVVMNMDVDENE